jgi:hypothetical protein
LLAGFRLCRVLGQPPGACHAAGGHSDPKVLTSRKQREASIIEAGMAGVFL